MSTKIIAQLNPFSSEKKIWNEDDSSINEIIKKIDCQNAVNAGWRILLNDEIITDFSTVTHDGDTLYIKIVPEGDSPKELGAGEKIAGGLLTALGVAALFIPGLGPAVGIALIGSGIGLFANGCVMYNLNLSQKDRESPVQDPSIRGSKNQIRQYGNIPILFGKRRIYPDLATTAYTWVENGQQYLYQLFCCGQKNQTIDTSTIKIGETLLTDYSSSGNIEDVLSGDDSLIQMQIAYGENTPPLLTKCVHEDILNTVLKHQTEDELDGSIVRTTPENTTEINVDIFFYNGLGQYNDDGDVEDCSVTVKAWYKRSDQDDSHYVQLGHFTSDDVITEHELKTKRFSIHKTGLTANSYTVKIERVTEDSDDSKIIDQCYVGSIRAIKNESPVSSARCRQLTLIGLKIKSSEKLNNYIEQLNFISQSSLPCYSGTGSGALQWNNAISSNPASAAIYAMQGEVSQQKLNNSEIDWPAFEKLYTWCNQHEYECNEYLTDSMSISELLSAIGSTCRAEIFRQNGKITVIQDIERDGFVQLFTPRNSWDYEESIAMPDIPDAMALGFVDEEAGYVKQEAKIYNTSNGEKISEPETTQDVTLWGVTSSKQARKLGMYKYAVSRARPIVHKFSADFEYMLCGKGDWIKYAGDIALAGITQGRIASLIISGNTITGFTSDELLPMEDGQSYAVRIRKNDGTAILKNISSHSEDCMTVYFDTVVSLNVLHEGDLFTFGYVGNDSIDLIITDIHCGDNLSAEIIAVEYSPEIFAVDDSGFVLPTFINRITEIPSIKDSGQLSDIEEPVKIVTTSILYAASSNGVTPPATGWDSSIPTVSPGNFLWTQTKVFYTDNKSTVSYSVAKQGATGAKGDKGDTGATGPQGAKGDKGDDGANAIVMTSPTTPSGTYNGQVGIYNTQLYIWNGSAWVLQDSVLPTEPILHYSFDEVPDLPDGNYVLRHTEMAQNDFISQTSGQWSVQLENGRLKCIPLLNFPYIIHWASSVEQMANKYVIVKFRCTEDSSLRMFFYTTQETNSTPTVTAKKGELVTLIGKCPASNNQTVYLRFVSAPVTFYIEQFYIGDLGYSDTNIIENSGNWRNGNIANCTVSQGINGKGLCLGGLNNQGVFMETPMTQTISWSAWFKCVGTSYETAYPTAQEIVSYGRETSDGSNKVGIHIDLNSVGSANNLYFGCGNKDNQKQISYSFGNKLLGNWHHVVAIKTPAHQKLYINGILVAQIDNNLELDFNPTCAIGILNFGTSKIYFGFNGVIDDVMAFERELSDKEVLGLYLAKGNTPKQYTESDYRFDCIDNDGIITPSEKKTLLSKWLEIYNQKNVTSALTYNTSDNTSGEYVAHIKSASSSSKGASVTQVANYINATNSIRNAMWGTNGILLDMASNSNVNAGDIDSLYATYGKCKEDLEFICRNATTNITNNNYEYNTTGEYLGKKTSAPSISNVNKCDFFLANGISGYDTGYIYYKADHSSTSWTKDTNTSSGRYVQAMADLLTIANSTGANNFSQLLASYTAFINTLSSSSAFIQNLFANFITIGKLIKTDNFNGSYDSQGNITSEGTTGFAFDKNGEIVANDISLRGLLDTQKITESRIIQTFTPSDLSNNFKCYLFVGYCNTPYTNPTSSITLYTSNCDPYIKIYVNNNGTLIEVSKIWWYGLIHGRSPEPVGTIFIQFFDSNNNVINQVGNNYSTKPVQIRYVLTNERCLRVNMPKIPIFMDSVRKELFSSGGIVQTGDPNPLIKLRFEAGTSYSIVYAELLKYISTTHPQGNYFKLSCIGQYRYDISAIGYASDERICLYENGNSFALQIYPDDYNSVLEYRLVLAFIYTKDV